MLPSSETIITHQLSNGLRVWVYENFESQVALAYGYTWGGYVNEGPDQAGLADIVTTMLGRGTEVRDYDAMNKAAESVGAFIGFTASNHTLGFNFYALAEDFSYVLGLMAESLTRPTFPAEELEKVRSSLITQLEERKHSTRSMAFTAFNQLIYPPGHPYRIEIDAKIATLRQVQREHLFRFYRQKVSPRGGVVVVVGAIRAEEAIARLEEALGQWRHPDAHPGTRIPPRPTLNEKKEKYVRVHGKSQSDIVMGWPGIRRAHPDYDAMLVCNAIWGRFGLGGRLGNRIREEMGLAYYANSAFSANLGAGTWRIAAGVNASNVQRAIDAMHEETARIVHEPVSDSELLDVQNYLTGSLPLQLETNGGIAGYLLSMAWFDLGMDYLQTYEARIRGVTKEDVLRVANTYLDPERYALAVAGPPDEEA